LKVWKKRIVITGGMGKLDSELQKFKHP
jgi:hypothetical protein